MSTLSFRKSSIIVLALGALAAVSIFIFPASWAGAQGQVVGYRAGVSPFRSGQAGIYVKFSKPMPTANYAVAVQPTNTAGYSPTKDCTYFNVLKKTVSEFQVQHKRCDDGVPVKLDVNVSLNWIAWSYN